MLTGGGLSRQYGESHQWCLWWL